MLALVGKAAESKGWNRLLQANTIKNRRVLSLFYIGMEVLTNGWEVTKEDLMEALASAQCALCA